jgi:hypothetical protein
MSVGVSAWGAVKRAKYHDESTKVSIVSVSRSAAAAFRAGRLAPCRMPVERVARHVEGPRRGAVRQAGFPSSPAPHRRSRNARPGSARPSSAAAKDPSRAGGTWSRRGRRPFPRRSDGGVDGLRPRCLGLPVEGQGPVHLFRLRRDKGVAAILGLHVVAGEGTKVDTTSSPYFRAKSRSRWSCAGQPKIAPVP